MLTQLAHKYVTARITVVGSLNMDLVARSPRIPRPGETIIGGNFCTVPGGKGANQAIAAARLGAQVSIVGRVGCDAFAGALLDNLSAANVDHRFVIQDPEATTGVALIAVDDAGQNSIVVASGTNMRLSPADIDKAEVARAHRVTVVLNPAPARQLPAELLTMVDVLIPNESETALLTGLPVSDQAEAETSAVALWKASVSIMILTLGERGALLAREQGVAHIPAFDVTPVDTTVAGDAFVGGFAVALAAGQTLAEAVRWGNATGGLAATKLGAQPSLPTCQDLERLLNETRTH